MVIITAEWQAKPGQEEALKEHLETMVTQVRKNEPKCLEYTLHQGLDDPATFFFYERYLDRAAVELHKTTPHFKALITNTESMIAKPVDVQLLQPVR